MKKIVKVTEVLPTLSGTGKEGKAWATKTFAGETIYDEYPTTLAFDSFKEDVIESIGKLQVGQIVEVNFRINCRRNAGVSNDVPWVRYFTGLTVVSYTPIVKPQEGAQ